MSGSQDIKAKLTSKADSDPDFRKRLLADPKATVEKELGSPLPAGSKVHVVEEDVDNLYLVLPLQRDRSKLTEHELDAVAGGRAAWCKNCTD